MSNPDSQHMAGRASRRAVFAVYSSKGLEFGHFASPKGRKQNRQVSILGICRDPIVLVLELEFVQRLLAIIVPEHLN
jgi:hypothetical protein